MPSLAFNGAARSDASVDASLVTRLPLEHLSLSASHSADVCAMPSCLLSVVRLMSLCADAMSIWVVAADGSVQRQMANQGSTAVAAAATGHASRTQCPGTLLVSAAYGARGENSPCCRWSWHAPHSTLLYSLRPFVAFSSSSSSITSFSLFLSLSTTGLAPLSPSLLLITRCAHTHCTFSLASIINASYHFIHFSGLPTPKDP